MPVYNSIFNNSLVDIANALSAGESFCICGHVSPDGDCIGSELALYWALSSLGLKVTCLLAKPDPLERSLTTLPGVDMLKPAEETDTFPVFISVDVPNPDRLGSVAKSVREKASLTISIDHHETDTKTSDLQFTDPTAASTTCLIWELIKVLGIEVPIDSAICCYAGLMTDTGRFQYQNADSRAFISASEMVEAGVDVEKISANFFQNSSLAEIKINAITARNLRLLKDRRIALSYISLDDIKDAQAQKSDTEGAINVVRSLGGVDVACVLKENEDCIRGSLRSKDGTDVAEIASEFGGGGHKAAAGFTMYCTLQDALCTIEKRLCEAVDAD